MKFEEFKKYKVLAESKNVELLGSNLEAKRVYQWMEETGRIDEGFWSSIWSWLKRNLSPTSRKIYALAEEYEKELIEEYRAEYGKLKYKDLDSKFRRSWAGRIAEDIETKMNLVAGDDKDYRELVSVLVNKKKLKVKKQTLKELEGKMDPEYENDPDGFFKRSYRDLDTELEELDNKEKNVLNDINTDNPEVMKKGTESLKRIISGNSIYRNMGYDNTSRIQNLIQKILVYQKRLEEKEEVEMSVKELEKTLKKFTKFVIDVAKKIENSEISKEKSLSIVAKIIEKMLVDEKIDNFEKKESLVLKLAEKEVESLKKETKSDTKKETKSDDIDIEEEVTGPLTGEILEPKEVKATIKAAEDNADEDSPEEIVKEINDRVEEFFKDEKEKFLKVLKDKVKKFNSLTEKERKEAQGEFKYSLDDKNELQEPSSTDLAIIQKNFINLVGTVVSYNAIEKQRKSIFLTINYISDFLFEIYALKKDVNGVFTKENANALLKIINERK